MQKVCRSPSVFHSALILTLFPAICLPDQRPGKVQKFFSFPLCFDLDTYILFTFRFSSLSPRPKARQKCKSLSVFQSALIGTRLSFTSRFNNLFRRPKAVRKVCKSLSVFHSALILILEISVQQSVSQTKGHAESVQSLSFPHCSDFDNRI